MSWYSYSPARACCTPASATRRSARAAVRTCRPGSCTAWRTPARRYCACWAFFIPPIAQRPRTAQPRTAQPDPCAAGGRPETAGQAPASAVTLRTMLPTGHLLAFALLSSALIVVPGPNVLFVISRALQLGRAAGLAAVVGGVIGVYVQVIAVALGIGALVERSVAVFTVIKLAGAAYLVYLGVQAVRHRRSLAAALEARVVAKSTGRMLRDGLVVGVTNPK